MMCVVTWDECLDILILPQITQCYRIDRGLSVSRQEGFTMKHAGSLALVSPKLPVELTCYYKDHSVATGANKRPDCLRNGWGVVDVVTHLTLILWNKPIRWRLMKDQQSEAKNDVGGENRSIYMNVYGMVDWGKTSTHIMSLYGNIYNISLCHEISLTTEWQKGHYSK